MAINTIICATKGSKESQIAEDKAIETAKENNSNLIFLFVIDAESMDKGGDVSEGGLEEIETGLKNIGKVILENAEEKAIENGLSKDKIFKEEVSGNFLKVLQSEVEKNNADLVVIGHSLANRGIIERQLMSKSTTDVFEKQIKDVLKCQILIV